MVIQGFVTAPWSIIIWLFEIISFENKVLTGCEEIVDGQDWFLNILNNVFMIIQDCLVLNNILPFWNEHGYCYHNY